MFSPVRRPCATGQYSFLSGEEKGNPYVHCSVNVSSSTLFLFVPGRGAKERQVNEGLWRCFTISKKEMQINEEIREKEIRLLGPEGEALGFMSSKEALELAEQKNLDLVMIAPTATPPVCRIMDYGKYRFEQAKRDKEAKKKQKVIEIKEVRMSLNIDVHDFNTKVNQAVKFMTGGDRVKVSIRFRGRELAHTNLGNGVMDRFAQACSEIGNVEKPPKMEGRSMVMFLSPKPAVKNAK